jgi:uncharacterized repeat protein (TIGR01451 family)
MSRLIVVLGLVLLVAALVPAGTSASLSPPAKIELSLRQRMEAASPGEYLSALVVLRERVDLTEMEPQLVTLGRRARHERVVRTLQETAVRTQGPLLAYLETQALHGRVAQIEPFWIANVVAVEATPAVLAEVAGRPDVASLRENRFYPIESVAGAPVPQVSPDAPQIGLVRIGADQMWARGWTGEGVLVATVDTGAWLPHQALYTRWRGYEPGVQPDEAWFDYWSVTTTPSDTLECGSHGTHVMGTIVGDDGFGNQIGVAPGAHWIAARIFGPPGGGCSSSDASKLAAWQWLADPDGNPGTVDDFPHVVNRSGGEGGGGYCRNQDFLWDAVVAVVNAGATVFFGAGNYGPAPSSIISWASQIESDILTFSVGNVNGYDPALPIRDSSSRGPSPCDFSTIKPEVVAPGVNIMSSVIPNPAPYGYKTGTSMSTPHVSGAAALLWQAFPYAGAETIQYALLESALDLGTPGEDNDYGMGFIYLPDAYHWLFDPGGAITASADLIGAGQQLTYTVNLFSQGQVSGTASLTDTLPAGTTYVPGSLWASTGDYAFSGGTITWSGVLHPSQPEMLLFAVTVGETFSDCGLLTNTAFLDDGLEVLTLSVGVTVDVDPPASLADSPAYASAPFTITFVASDACSGVDLTQLWARYEGGAWAPTGLTMPGETGAFSFTPAQGDGSYYLATQAVDQVGLEESPPSGDGDTVTLFDTQAPTSTAASPVSTTVPAFTVSWSGDDGPVGSGIEAYRIEVLEASGGGTWTVWISETTALSDTYSGAAGSTFCFRSTAWDLVGNVELPPDDPLGDSCTQVSVAGWEIFLPLIVRGG